LEAQLQDALEDKAEAEKRETEAERAKADAEASKLDLQKAEASLTERVNTLESELQSALKASVEAQGRAASGLSSAKAGALGRMLQEQQLELREGYRFSAACKLSLALGRSGALSLAHALAAWRHVCRLQQLEATVLAQSSLAADSGAQSLRLAEVEAALSASVGERESAREEAVALRERLGEVEAAADKAREKLSHLEAQLQDALEDKAEAEKRETEAERAKADAEASKLDLQKAEASLTERVNTLESELQSALKASVEAQGRAASGLSSAKAGALGRMLQEQQLELREGYRFSAACKLSLALGRSGALSLAHALAAWRNVCNLRTAVEESSADLVAMQERVASLDAECRKVTKENRSMALSLRSLEAQLASAKRSPTEAARTSSHQPPLPSQQPASQLTPLPTPQTAPLRSGSKPPLSPSVSAKALPTIELPVGQSHSASRPSSPGGSSLAESLGDAIAAAKSRPTSPKLTLAEQLGQAVSARSRRTEKQPSTPTEVAFCSFCGLEADKNVVRCSTCYKHTFHIRCLSSAQAARFKGRRWLCDDCIPPE